MELKREAETTSDTLNSTFPCGNVVPFLTSEVSCKSVWERDADVRSEPVDFQKDADLGLAPNINLVITNRVPKANTRSFHHF